MLSSILCISFVTQVLAQQDKPILLQIQPETIINVLQKVIKSEYMKTLADEFAIQAMKAFKGQISKEKISQTNYKERLDPEKSITLLEIPKPMKLPKEQPLHPLEPAEYVIRGQKPNENLLGASSMKAVDGYSDEKHNDLMALVEAPPSDGDNLEKEFILSDMEETKTVQPEKHAKIYRINGRISA